MQQAATYLYSIYGDQILRTERFPAPYCPGGIPNAKAIYLGCDPSNKHSDKLPYVFAHESKLPVFNAFLQHHTEQLSSIGLGWNSVYTQNLCRNYFQKETGANTKLFKQVALEYWLEKLKMELSILDEKIPVLLTSQILLEILGIDGYQNIKAIEFYECRIPLPVPATGNLLGRPLIPLYRGKNPRLKMNYQVKNWEKYREAVITCLNFR